MTTLTSAPPLTITFQVEDWRTFIPDATEIMRKHHGELALDQDKIELALDYDRYEAMRAAGILHVVTMRDAGKLVGYFVAFLLPHVHYRKAGLMAFTDIYYVMPEYRRAGGAQLFIQAEKTMKERGVTKAYLSCKVHQDHSALFEHLGWTFTDKSFTKYLGDK